MSFLNDLNVDKSWQAFIENEQVLRSLDAIWNAVSNTDFYPDPSCVLRFMGNDAEQIKHIIVGMDPYPSWNEKLNCPQATGRSFEVSELYDQNWDYKIKQSSLRNILKSIYYNETRETKPLSDIRAEIVSGAFSILAPTIWFDNMETQGVVFLNSTLTVAAGKPGSHRELWAEFREMLAAFILECSPDAKWHLWGKDAQEEYGVLLPDNVILKSCHPRLIQFVEENTLQYATNVDWLGELPPLGPR